MAKLSSVALSNNVNTVVVNNPEGIDGKVNETSDGRAFVVLTFKDESNPFNHRTGKRTYMSDNEGKFRGLTPAQLKKFEGKEIESVKFHTAQVEPYEIEGRTVTTYTTCILAGENPETVFKNSGHPFANTAKVNTTTGEVISA